MSNSPLAGGTITTRRRPIDFIEYAEENGIGKVNIGQHHHQHRRTLVISLMRPGRYLSRWIFAALMLLMVSTMFVKIILIHIFLRVNATMNTSRDFLQLPRHLMHAQVLFLLYLHDYNLNVSFSFIFVHDYNLNVSQI